MSDHVCVSCEHGPHRKSACAVCGCKSWQNSAVVTARGVVALNNMLVNLIQFGFPDLAEKIKQGQEAEYKEMIEQFEKEKQNATTSPDSNSVSGSSGAAADRNGSVVEGTFGAAEENSGE